jgi:hypothetical protein
MVAHYIQSNYTVLLEWIMPSFVNGSIMIEVFKTNITSIKIARWLTKEIHKNFIGYQVNFDLSDCDRILRVVYNNEHFHPLNFTNWLKTKGCHAEVLPDN